MQLMQWVPRNHLEDGLAYLARRILQIWQELLLNIKLLVNFLIEILKTDLIMLAQVFPKCYKV